ncbi:MAG: aminoglycoside phosphotransferase family protein [Sphingomonadales bacterium]|nr:aminoglycoside phosphotransferase family protein [Sphingomonadales bacterium]MDE2569705.1 aminoglycoside phosphotransferase family protein [Sphingomonadales bacterium]
MPDDSQPIHAALSAAGLLAPGETPRITPLAGGVSCDVFRVDLAQGPVCAKRALAQLRVKDTWEAPVERLDSEVGWLRIAAETGLNVPEVIAHQPGQNLFVMGFLDPAQHPVWKAELAAGRIDAAFAARVGRDVARVHGATHGQSDIAARFETLDQFRALRIEPYLLHTACRHPDLAPVLHGLAERTAVAQAALVHGDISPKNILCGPKGPVFIDAECAWFGEPAFDPAFCLTMLMLKCVWKPQWAAQYVAAFKALAEAYLSGVTWEPREAIARRIALYVAAFLLARVDGKSPAEYLVSDADRELVRSGARALLFDPPSAPHLLADFWLQHTGRQ